MSTANQHFIILPNVSLNPKRTVIQGETMSMGLDSGPLRSLHASTTVDNTASALNTKLGRWGWAGSLIIAFVSQVK